METRERRTQNPMAIQLAEALAKAKEKVVPTSPEATALDILRDELIKHDAPQPDKAFGKMGRPKEALRMWLETSKPGDAFVEIRDRAQASLYLLAARAGRKITLETRLLVGFGTEPTAQRVHYLTVTDTCEPQARTPSSGSNGADNGD